MFKAGIISMIRYYFILVFRKLCCVLRVFPLRKNRMLFYSFAGKEYSDSPRYIAEYLEETYPQKYEIIWALRDRKQGEGIIERGWKTVPYKGAFFFYYYATAKCVITNTGPFKLIPGRKGQEIINTWHGGGAYKKTGVDNPYKDKYLVLCNKNFGQKDVTLFLTSSKAFTRYCIRGAFLYQGKVMECGLPRNDVLICPGKSNAREKICHKYGIDAGKKIILYAPTWRNYELPGAGKIDADGITDACMMRFGGEWIFFYRGHNLSEETGTCMSDRLIDVTKYEDMQELLCISDVLISDYSSCIWDYSLLKRPCFLFVPDLKQYEKVFDFYTPIEKWGFPIATSNGELKERILHFEWERALDDMEKAQAYLGIQETGKAREKVIEYITALQVD